MEYPAFLHRALYEQRGTREICICYRSVSGVSDTGLPGQIGTVGTGRFAEFHDLFGWSDFISKLFPIMEAPKSMTCYFDLGMRNKVLSVLLAAGMVASMPAATAFNVMADDADAVVGADNSVSDNYKDPVWTLAEDDPTTTNVDETNSYAILNLTQKSDNSTVKIKVDGDKTTETKGFVNGTAESFEHKDTTATCTADGTETIIASAYFDNHTWTKTFSNVAVKAYGHNYDYKDGKWIWTKTGNKNTDGTDEYAVTFVYSCSRCGNIASTAVPSENISEVIVGDNGAAHTNFYPSCTSNARVNFNAFVKIGDTTYYPKGTATTKAYKTNDKGYLVDASGNVLYKQDNAKAPATDYDQLSADDQKKAVEIGFYNDGATEVAESKDSDFYYTYTPGHDWQVKKDFDWTVKSDYKDAKGNDIYLNTAAKKAKSESDFVLSDHYTNAKVTFACKSPYHTSNDGEKTAEVSAWIYADQDPATCTTDATTTYYAYVFKDADDIKAKLADLVSKVNASGNDKIEIGTSDSGLLKEATDFYNENQVDNNGQGFGSFQATKTDTWEGSATGHNYRIANWTWSNDFSYVNLNLICDGDNSYVTVQSSKITKNADGTAKVVYTAKDARKYANVNWYGKDGYYLDQTKNPYGKEYTINALPLKNAGDVNNGKIVMTRLYNKTTGEHLYTSDANEIKTLVNEYNWTNEGTAWNAPAVSNTPVYRMFNRVTGEHVYTKDLNEVNTLSKKDEWNNEGIAWYSDDNKTVPVYRQFNPKAATSKASHNYTTSTNEKKTLTSQYGWNDEGIGWYGV